MRWPNSGPRELASDFACSLDLPNDKASVNMRGREIVIRVGSLETREIDIVDHNAIRQRCLRSVQDERRGAERGWSGPAGAQCGYRRRILLRVAQSCRKVRLRRCARSGEQKCDGCSDTDPFWIHGVKQSLSEETEVYAK